jgi:hypothetical protein
MHDCPSVPRPSPWDSGTVAARWDTNCPTAVPPAPMSSNSWRSSKPLQPERWDKNCPGAVPPHQGDCPKLPLPSVPLGQPAKTPWSVQDWRAFYEERAGIRQHDGGQPVLVHSDFYAENLGIRQHDSSRAEALAARGAWLDTVALWLERHPVCPVAKLFWDSELLRLARIAESVEALAALGIREPPPPPPAHKKQRAAPARGAK